jgi:hypothetical protein
VASAPNAVVTLFVRNNSSEVIRFAHRGVMSESVSVQLEKRTGQPWSSGFFVPEVALRRAAGVRPSQIGEYRFAWALVDKVPTVTLSPRRSYSLRLPLKDVLSGHTGSTIPAGEYDIHVSSIFQMLIGSPTGPFADLAPVRFPASGSSILTVR